MKRVCIESPLAGDFELNRRYALWCAYHCYTLGEAAYASHLFYTQFLDDTDPEQRAFGIAAGLTWAKSVKQVFYVDLGWSKGMLAASAGILLPTIRTLPPAMLEKFHVGELPKATRGFERPA